MSRRNCVRSRAFSPSLVGRGVGRGSALDTSGSWVHRPSKVLLTPAFVASESSHRFRRRGLFPPGLSVWNARQEQTKRLLQARYVLRLTGPAAPQDVVAEGLRAILLDSAMVSGSSDPHLPSTLGSDDRKLPRSSPACGPPLVVIQRHCTPNVGSVLCARPPPPPLP